MTSNFLKNLTGNNWPRLKSEQVSADSAELVIVPHAELNWFRGHFPGHAVLPGVVQVHWASLWGKGLLGITGEFSCIENLKFKRIITPGLELTVGLEYSSERSRLMFTFTDASHRYSSGRIYFTP